MNFILENYLVIILVGMFFVFALIGYLIDLLRKDRAPKQDIPKDVQMIQNEKVEEQQKIAESVNNNVQQETNKLLTAYDNNQLQNSVEQPVGNQQPVNNQQNNEKPVNNQQQ